MAELYSQVPKHIARGRRRTVGRAVLVLAALTMLWSLAIRITGGFVIETGWRTISSRNSVRPLFAGLAVVAVYLLLWRRHWREDLGPLATPRPWPRLLTTLSVATALLAGFGWGTRIGAGPDPSGYVSEAAMFARGELTLEAPGWARSAPWPGAALVAAPVGWRPTQESHLLAPVYSPGLPLLMAMFERTAGPQAVFFVVPLLGGLLVWSTFVIGSKLEDEWAGAVAAVLVVSSPIFILMQLQAMSDVPVTAFLAASVAAALGGHAVLAGVAAGAAVLTRPNLAPLIAVPLLLLVIRRQPVAHDFRLKPEATGLKPEATWLVRFALPVAVACAIVGALNWRYFGSPIVSGYGPLAGYYSLENVAPNMLLYWEWFTRSHTAWPLVGFLAVMVGARHSSGRWPVVLVVLVIPLILLLTYLPYVVFHLRDWWYLRFLLPAYPMLAVGCGIMAAVLARRLGRFGPILAVAAIVLVAAYGWTFSIRDGSFGQRRGDARFAQTIDYVKRLPARSVLVSNAHSGTLRFYTGRDVFRFEATGPQVLDAALSHLRQLGYALFLIGDEFEIDQFKTLFAGTRAVASLPREPRASLEGVAIYELK